MNESFSEALFGSSSLIGVGSGCFSSAGGDGSGANDLFSITSIFEMVTGFPSDISAPFTINCGSFFCGCSTIEGSVACI